MSIVAREVSQNAPPACLDNENSHRLVSLWWAMHHSNDPDLQALVVTCYLDESATDGSTPTAVVGGLLVNSSHFIALDKQWNVMLDDFSLRPGLHMKDFGLHGRFADMSTDERATIFTRAVEIIRDHNICTIAVTMQHSQYKAILSESLGREMSPYGLCFTACVIGNHQIAKTNKYDKRVAFVVDSGNPYAHHVLLAHQGILETQTGEYFLNLGSLTFDKDDNVTALQAADVVCWAVRRRATGYPFSDGFGPTEQLLETPGHNQALVPELAMHELLARLQAIAPEILKEP